jgi:hypothetical protein
VRSLRRVMQRLERCLVPLPHVERFVADHRPDVFLVTPLVGLGSSQADYLRAAKRLGVRTGYPVLSWDNLTTKGLVRDLPDLVLVWNELQVDEATRLQGIPRDRIRVAGAWSWDHWFDWRPQRTRAEFCQEVGLSPDRPIVLYVGSGRWVIHDEVDFVRRWVASLRLRGGVLAEAGLLVRPHPNREISHWADARLDDPNVAVWPRFGEEPLSDAARQNYFESIYYSAAVFGINTSAQIEGAIVGRPVHTLLSDEFRETQQDTLHFPYLTDGVGHLHVARTLEEHAALLEESLYSDTDDGRNERFVRRFARPFGLDVPATPISVEAIEELAAQPTPAPDHGPPFAAAARVALRPLAVLAARGAARRRDAKPKTPARELRMTIRALVREKGEHQIVAGPWLGDEIGELLYWIPFLRWAQTANLGLRERLHVVMRAGREAWYRGLGVRRVALEEEFSVDGLDESLLPEIAGTPDFRVLSPSRVTRMRGELARQAPGVRVQHRLLDFALLVPDDLPEGFEVPDEFVAVRFDEEHDELALEILSVLAERGPVVALDPPEGLTVPGHVHVVEGAGLDVETALLARARGFVGSYGFRVYLAALLGLPAVGLYRRREAIADDDLQIARAFLDRPPFGRMHTLEAGDAHETAQRAADLVERGATVLARTR